MHKFIESLALAIIALIVMCVKLVLTGIFLAIGFKLGYKVMESFETPEEIKS
jgi:hypothetical protein